MDARYNFIGSDGKWVALASVVGLIVLALSGPQIAGYQIVTVADNLDIIIVLDNTFSMAANDVEPSRHDQAVKNIRDFLGGSAMRSGDRLTLFVFGNQSKWTMPLSDDVNEFRDKLFEVEQPKDKVYTDGNQLYTNITIALAHIPDALIRQDNFYQTLNVPGGISWAPYKRVAFMFTDGDDSLPSLVTIRKNYDKQDISMYAVVIGTSQGAEVKVKVIDQDDPKKFNSLTIKTKASSAGLSQITSGGDKGIYLIDQTGKSAVGFMNSVVINNRSGTPHLVKKYNPDNFWRQVLTVCLGFISIMILLS